MPEDLARSALQAGQRRPKPRGGGERKTGREAPGIWAPEPELARQQNETENPGPDSLTGSRPTALFSNRWTTAAGKTDRRRTSTPLLRGLWTNKPDVAAQKNAKNFIISPADKKSLWAGGQAARSGRWDRKCQRAGGGDGTVRCQLTPGQARPWTPAWRATLPPRNSRDTRTQGSRSWASVGVASHPGHSGHPTPGALVT